MYENSMVVRLEQHALPKELNPEKRVLSKVFKRARSKKKALRKELSLEISSVERAKSRKKPNGGDNSLSEFSNNT